MAAFNTVEQDDVTVIPSSPYTV